MAAHCMTQYLSALLDTQTFFSAGWSQFPALVGGSVGAAEELWADHRVWKPLAERIAAESIVNVKQVRDLEGCNGVNFTHQSSAGKKKCWKNI